MKLQMKFQKILLIVSLVLAAVCIFYSFAYFTGSLSTLYAYMNNRKYAIAINCADTYFYGQEFNGVMLGMSIAYLLVIVAMLFMQCGKRRKYYISNYVVSIVSAVYIAVFAIVCIAMNATCMNMFLNDINWEQYRAIYDPKNPAYGYSDSCVMFILGFIVHILALLDAVAIALNLVWKDKLMKGEKQLLAQQAEAEVA